MIFNLQIILTKLMISFLLIGIVCSQQLNDKCNAKNEKMFCQDPNVCLCFVYKDERKSWRDANQDCQNSGGRLASFQKDRVQKLFPWLKTLLKKNQNYWVDLKREDRSGWRWTHYNEKVDRLTINEGNSISYPICAFAASDPYSRRAGFYASECYPSWDEKNLPVLCTVKDRAIDLKKKLNGTGMQELAIVNNHVLKDMRCRKIDFYDHFVVFNESYDHLTGLEKCKKIGGTLASFTAPEHEVVFKKMAAKAHDRDFGTWRVWIGLIKEDGTWKWDNGQKLFEVFEKKDKKREIFWNDNEPADIKQFLCGSLYYSETLRQFQGQSQNCFYNGNNSTLLSKLPFFCEIDYFKDVGERIETINLKDPFVADKINKIEGLKVFEIIENEIKDLLNETDITILQLINLKEKIDFIQMVQDQIKDRNDQTKTELEMISSLRKILEVKPFLTEEVQSVVGEFDVKSLYQSDSEKLIKRELKRELKEKLAKTLQPIESFKKSIRERIAALKDVLVERDEKYYDLRGQMHNQNEGGKDRKTRLDEKTHLSEVINSNSSLLVWGEWLVWGVIAVLLLTAFLLLLICCYRKYKAQSTED